MPVHCHLELSVVTLALQLSTPRPDSAPSRRTRRATRSRAAGSASPRRRFDLARCGLRSEERSTIVRPRSGATRRPAVSNADSRLSQLSANPHDRTTTSAGDHSDSRSSGALMQHMFAERASRFIHREELALAEAHLSGGSPSRPRNLRASGTRVFIATPHLEAESCSQYSGRRGRSRPSSRPATSPRRHCCGWATSIPARK